MLRGGQRSLSTGTGGTFPVSATWPRSYLRCVGVLRLRRLLAGVGPVVSDPVAPIMDVGEHCHKGVAAGSSRCSNVGPPLERFGGHNPLGQPGSGGMPVITHGPRSSLSTYAEVLVTTFTLTVNIA